MPRIKVTQIKSTIKRPEDQKRAIKALGLGRISKSNELEVNDALMGNIRKVSHLIKVEEI
ncbi:MAG: 50S ribosomal protein L30 [Luteibaculaceae bacterium]